MNAILMSIHKEHADAILAGTKRWELRKVQPIELVERIYMNVTGGVGVVGCFDVDFIYRDTPAEVWRHVSDSSGITKKRFDAYYGGSKWGTAFRVDNPIAFEQPVKPVLSPQGFLYLRNHPSEFEMLEDMRETAKLTHAEAGAAVGMECKV